MVLIHFAVARSRGEDGISNWQPKSNSPERQLSSSQFLPGDPRAVSWRPAPKSVEEVVGHDLPVLRLGVQPGGPRSRGANREGWLTAGPFGHAGEPVRQGTIRWQST